MKHSLRTRPDGTLTTLDYFSFPGSFYPLPGAYFY
jgi:hypothetical protein